MFVILRIKGEEGPRALDFDRSMPRVLPSAQGVSLKCPPSGPPKEFIDRYGISRDCIACRSIDEIGTRKGFSHSKSCCRRYEDWLRTQVQGQDNIEPVVHDSLKEALEECEYEPTTPGDPVEDSLDIFGKEDEIQEPPVKKVKTVKTRHCPACESGMVAPGIRHSKECLRNQENAKRSLEELGKSTHDDSMHELKGLDNMNPNQKAIDDELAHELGLSSESHAVKRPGESTEDLVVGHDHEHVADMEVDGSEHLDTEVAMTSSNMKRESEVPLVDLEEIRKETETDNLKRSNVLSSMVSAAFGVSEYVSMSDLLVDSVQFGAESDFEVLTFGNQKIKIWKPISAVDDSDMSELPGDQTLQGMVKEVGNLRDMEAGDLMTLDGVEKLKRDNPEVNFRTIGCRWVTTRKTVDTVRSRIVVKDVAEKNMPSARSLGISSPTPSSDAMFLLLGLAGCRDYAIGSADIAHAFMATPLRVRDVIIKLPLSVSSMRGEGMYIWLRKALNGLRKSSQDWVYFLSSIVKKVGTGLTSCSLEPCLFTGVLPSGPCGLLCYVDDLLLIAPKVEDVISVFDQIGKSVTLKKTGLVDDSSKGGSLRFLGRVISRQKGDSSVLVSLPSDYLDTTFAAYGLKEKVGNSNPPDIGAYVEKPDGVPLSPEAYARFRSALGKVAWLTQTRQDLRAYISILACQQASPSNHTEAGLRALLRFLMTDRNVAVRLPASGDSLKQSSHFDGQVHLVCFSDASHAPLRATKRRGISGGVLSVNGFVVKTLSRHQQMISLSSMESELFALQHVAQEMSSLGRIVARILRSFQETNLREVPGVLFSDSESALKLLRNMDVPRRSRHLEIRIEWLKGRVEEQKLVLEFRRGVSNPSDLLTKCLGSSAFGIHRESLGFEMMNGPILALSDLGHAFMIVEVCCSEDSAIFRVCKKLGIHYVGVTDKMEHDSTFRKVKEHVEYMNVKTFVHMSSPCSSGSPL